jgi:alginate O-acetyltransferase complex protein AlgI
VLFNSWQFLLGFLPAALLIHWITDRFLPAHRLAVLLALSIAFYSYWDVRFLALLLLSISINWLVTRVHAVQRRALMVAAISANICVLGVFKYTDFFTTLLAPIVSLPTSAIADLALPLGISFFTFHHVMYLTDLRAGIAPQVSLIKYGLYIAFFPQVLAGPLVRWSEILHQFDARPYQRPDATVRFAQGLMLLFLGLGKKVLLGDPLAKVADPIFHATTRLVSVPFMDAWQATLAFTLQIYFDFSGYTDMALGIALMFGILLPQNFNAPYRATSLQDFWRRWHMTLSRFLRDYLYIPLGGNRHGLPVQLLALILTMTLGGLWHGAGVNFVLWGALHGTALCVALIWSRYCPALPAAVAWVVTLAFVILTWVPFRAQDFNSAIMMWRGLAGMDDFDHNFASSDPWPLIVFASAIALIGPTSWSLIERARGSFAMSMAGGVLAAIIALRLSAAGSQQFIYFQF